MNQFNLINDRWFAWQMIPGYIGEKSVPYCSPIYLKSVKPLKTGKGLIKIDFINVFYAEGVQNFSLQLKVLKRAENYLVSEIIYNANETSERCAVISHIEFEWVKRFCPELWYNRPPSSCSSIDSNSITEYLNEVFLKR
ncbi:MAG: hypothetical protein OMM_10113 [Candidatus Magnetoglobus multicellularis str. Araruama]|uniref:Uncharacterized protein n=1 Tax=Candidatus Magnetoglobus multicellularis str. Araruama TaxID=890399 RepID=A0A1V1P222_9BACT|nr:MAG: hypothetical protein OMM_10113 [Candidatus Magnetoglobus multicellularis str. Araruama]